MLLSATAHMRDVPLSFASGWGQGPGAALTRKVQHTQGLPEHCVYQAATLWCQNPCNHTLYREMLTHMPGMTIYYIIALDGAYWI